MLKVIDVRLNAGNSDAETAIPVRMFLNFINDLIAR
jgi:hypothetical protein